MNNAIELPASDTRQSATQAIQKQIDASSESGGGVVVLPTGDHYVGTIRLRDNVELHLPTGCRLVGIPDPDLYPDTREERGEYTRMQFFRTLVLARDVSNCAITGGGTIDGQGHLFEADLSTEKGPPRPKLVWFDHCRNVRVKDVFLTRSAAWCAHFSLCEDVHIDGVRIHNGHQINNDGIDIDSCRRVRVSNCDVDAEDDALCFKTLHHEPCEDIVVTNCILRSRCYALKIGTESLYDFRNITVSNCTIYNTDRVGIGFEIHDGGLVENINISNIMMRNVDLPLYIRTAADRHRIYTDAMLDEEPPAGLPIRDVTLSNIHVQTIPGLVGLLEGLEQAPLEGIHLDNWMVRHDGEIVPRIFTAETYLSQGNLRKGPKPGRGEEIVQTTDPSWGKAGWHFWERLQNEYGLEGAMPSGFFISHAKDVTLDRVRLDGAELIDENDVMFHNCEGVV
jgi:hypothetical protein